MERQRRCGFLPQSELGRVRVVWARGSVSSTSCPVSYITPESIANLEYYSAWRLEGYREMHCLPARRADAFVILESETRKENTNG